jgi:hypothetical protein
VEVLNDETRCAIVLTALNVKSRYNRNALFNNVKEDLYSGGRASCAWTRPRQWKRVIKNVRIEE